MDPDDIEPDEDQLDGDDEEAVETVVTVEVSGLSLYTHVGVTEAEREIGQRLLLDLRLDVGDVDATITDRLEDTIDYSAVCQLANLVAQVGIIACCVGIFPASFWAFCVAAYAFAQAYRLATVKLQ